MTPGLPSPRSSPWCATSRFRSASPILRSPILPQPCGGQLPTPGRNDSISNPLSVRLSSGWILKILISPLDPNPPSCPSRDIRCYQGTSRASSLQSSHSDSCRPDQMIEGQTVFEGRHQARTCDMRRPSQVQSPRDLPVRWREEIEVRYGLIRMAR